jgi:predicted alpha/beta-hydrolase family hydrolase
VACRTAGALGAAGVVCLAFPLLPPTRAGSKRVPESRLQELEAVLAPVLVVQGANDRFGMPPPGPGRTVIEIAGDHSLRTDVHAVSDSVGGWLAQLLDGGL